METNMHTPPAAAHLDRPHTRRAFDTAKSSIKVYGALSAVALLAVIAASGNGRTSLPDRGPGMNEDEMAQAVVRGLVQHDARRADAQGRQLLGCLVRGLFTASSEACPGKTQARAQLGQGVHGPADRVA